MSEKGIIKKFEKNGINGKFRMAAAVVVLGSFWGLLECIIGEFSPSVMGLDISTGAILAGFFGLGLMAFGRRLFNVPGMAVGMGIVAGTMRYAAPVGSCVICSSIAIVAESVIFEMIINRPTFSLESTNMKDVRTLSFLGIIIAYTLYVSGYVITQIMTPLAASNTESVADVVHVLPIIFGTGFFAALTGGVSLPFAVRSQFLNIDARKLKKEFYYPISGILTGFCWIFMLAYFSFLGY